MFYGGLTGQLSWLSTYPFDVLKTIMQTQDFNSRMMEIARVRYREQGIRFFFRGMTTSLLRAFIVSAVLLPGFDLTNSLLLP